MKLSNVLLPLFAVVATLSAQDVRYNYAFGQDFSKLKTYSWADRNDSTVDELTAQQIKSAIDTELAKKGFVRRDKSAGDLMLSYQTSVDKEKSLTLYNTGFGYGRGWRTGLGSSSITTGETSTIRVGELALDIYGVDSKQLLWRGIIKDTIPDKQKPEQWQKQLDKGAVKLLKNFPPPAK